MIIPELFDLSGQTAVITGSGKGIGEGTAKLLSEAGASVVVSSRTEEDIRKVSDEIVSAGGSAIPIVCDVTKDEQVHALAKSALDTFGTIDIWVNNVGGSTGRTPLKELSREHWDQTIALTLTSVFVGCQVAAMNMKKGSIVNISSRSSWGAVPNNSHYAAAKAGVNVLTASLGHELGPDIRCNAVASGAVPTEIFFEVMDLKPADLPAYAKETGVPLERLGSPRDIAGAVLFLCSEASSWITGEVITVSGGR
ncbi:MAG: SDR family NAD(P)-dependent oxidoreductase [Acidimicrobiales bacterium]|jgi:NAD(P)-dependent dehydrogenase (short-subunit alcohol dehydrogenase family)|nr:SDR family NAD(P)-dependent oxidoreductase [Acidimicrobiales bacterium]MDP6298017.1 SDR family NAD(P)-dependent oxidoreductase [Acidimicrobiales bacterium]HJM28470.1 SDR family NAD(P)-dependent oxidoreductase [Acidimicrobiales bacterium]HJM98224.1 SDR family NAD(P)-dependent oxidoreductase [Acidimicrobiales bacterium]